MSKLDKLNVALILQDIESLYTGNVQNNIVSTAGNLAAGIKKDGFDQQDLAKLMLDQSFDQNPQGIMQKIQNNVTLHYDEIENLLNKNKDWKGLLALESMQTNTPDFETLGNSLSNCVKQIEKKEPGGIIHKDGQKCGTEHCAQFSNGYLRSLGYGTWGDAWDLNEVVPVYSGYDVSTRPNKYNQTAVEQYNYNAADKLYKEFKSGTLDKNKTYAVNMFYKGSPNLKKAYQSGRDGISGTHTGYLRFDPKTNRWKVVHNIHNQVHVDDFISIQGSKGDWGVTAIYAPTKAQPTMLQRVANAVYNLVTAPLSLFAEGGQFETNGHWVTLSIGDKQYKAIVAKSEKEKEQGLQNVESLESNEGMLFDYMDEPQKKISFWMKDTTVELDIVFINNKLEVEDIKVGKPLSESLLTCKPDDGVIIYVLEVPSGSGIQIGDKLSVDLDYSDDSDNNSDDSDEKSPEASLEILGSNGETQAMLQGGERIFSIKNTKTLVSLAKRAYESQSDSDYKALGRKIFEYMKIQDDRDPEYVEN